MDDLYRMPGHLVRRVQQISSALFAEETAGFDITSVQFAALFAIRSNPDVDATRLSHLVAFDRSTLGDVIERIETKGWIVRNAAPHDRRIKLLRLTPEGEALLGQVLPAVGRVQERLVAPLSAPDRATMVRLLAQIAQVHNDVTPAPLRAVAQG
jgi:DNA-binding MarR family transcriptional regulator